MAVIRANIQVNGIVQGVGFRPFIHKLITGEALSGWIRNTSEGAEIELEGEEASVQRFLSDLRTKTPKLAVIESVHTAFFSELMGYQGFEIRQSKALMRGHKGEYFTLCLSFFGWLLLSGLTLGILGIWLEPYMTVTQANYYNSLIGWQPAEAVLPDDAPPAPDAWWGQ